MPRSDIYTDAPPAYDGFGTQTTAVIGTLDGRTLRAVAVHAAHLDWQRTRYGSGCYLGATEEEYRRLFAANVVPLKAVPDYSPRERLAVYAPDLLATLEDVGVALQTHLERHGDREGRLVRLREQIANAIDNARGE